MLIERIHFFHLVIFFYFFSSCCGSRRFENLSIRCSTCTRTSFNRICDPQWVLSKSHSKAILIQNNMHFFHRVYNNSPTSSEIHLMRTRWNRCSHIRFECFVLTQKNARKLNKSLMASLKPTNSPHAGTSSDGRWALARPYVALAASEWMGNDSLQTWANACFKRNPFNLTLLTQIILNKLLLPNATQLQTCSTHSEKITKTKQLKKRIFK